MKEQTFKGPSYVTAATLPQQDKQDKGTLALQFK